MNRQTTDAVVTDTVAGVLQKLANGDYDRLLRFGGSGEVGGGNGTESEEPSLAPQVRLADSLETFDALS